jgi:hypothetical protein
MTHRTIAKLLGPAMLLTAALSLPAASVAAPPSDRGHQADQVKKQKKVEVTKTTKVKAAKATKVKTTKVKKTTKQLRVVQAAPQQQIVIRRSNPAPRTVYVQPAQAQYRRGTPSAGENSPLFAVEGYLAEGRRCLALRDHRGNLYTLVGKTEGLEIGDHVALMVRRVLPVYARECGEGDTVRVGQVRTIWADRNHSRAMYDSRYDGAFNPYQRDRYERDRSRDRYGRYDGRYDDRNDGRYDDRNDGRYDDRYDGRYGSRNDDDRYYDTYERDNRGENGRLISVTGRLGGDRDCATLRDRDGRLFGLSGDLRHYDPGDTVKVIGFLQGGSRCGGANIDVEEITRP